MITTSAPSTASAADAATTAPAAASVSVASGDRSHTVVRSPAASRLRAIAEPMMPVPSTATLVAARPGLSVIAVTSLRRSASVRRPASQPAKPVGITYSW